MNVPGSLKHSADSADTAATAELEVSARHGDGGAGGDDGDSDGAGGEDSDRCDSPGYLPRHSEVGDGSQLVHMESDNVIMILCRRSPPSHRSHRQNPRHASNSQ